MKLARVHVIRIANVAVVTALMIKDHSHWEQISRRCLVGDSCFGDKVKARRAFVDNLLISGVLTKLERTDRRS